MENNNELKAKVEDYFNTKNLKDLILNIILSLELSIFNENPTENKGKIMNKNEISYFPIAFKRLEVYFLSLTKSIQDETVEKDFYCILQSTVVNNNIKEEGKECLIKDINLINFIVNLTSHIYEKLPRSKLNFESKEKLVSSINSIFELMDKYVSTLIISDGCLFISKLRSLKNKNEISI